MDVLLDCGLEDKRLIITLQSFFTGAKIIAEREWANENGLNTNKVKAYIKENKSIQIIERLLNATYALENVINIGNAHMIQAKIIYRHMF
ncbi:Rossmann-fold NAD(P)-binding domain-containing protein [Candidatus Walczuchella monophlebidarum]|uniref:hypothetical protein n=1 Tax=Candidatus Walczuchella monophlebidarum TaxID=1415657 RepID=UPI0018F1EEBD|nr:hypothetical protein [Candidatus Walczuchella monophlebidarum]